MSTRIGKILEINESLSNVNESTTKPVAYQRDGWGYAMIKEGGSTYVVARKSASRDYMKETFGSATTAKELFKIAETQMSKGFLLYKDGKRVG